MNYPIHLDEQGRYVHTWVRQSSIKTADMCMERLRHSMYGISEEPKNDGAELGTACHQAVEDVLQSRIDGEGIMTEYDMYDAFDYYWEEMSPQVDNWYSYGDTKTAWDMGRVKLKSWYDHILPMIEKPVSVEQQFNKVLIEDSERVVYLRGTVDLVEEDVLWDWKFPKADYTRDRWQYDRWDVQSIAYTWAMDIPYFRYGVMHNKGWGTMEFVRNDLHHDWLREKVASICRYVEQTSGKYLLNDNGWWCSEKWCPAWTRCKGWITLESEEQHGVFHDS